MWKCKNLTFLTILFKNVKKSKADFEDKVKEN